MPDNRVIVVGTTGDYIDMIATRYPGRTQFVTDPVERAKWPETVWDETPELVCDLEDTERLVDAVRRHLDQHQINPTGVACYDCESLTAAAHIARALSLPFPSPEAVIRSRSKFLSKKLWLENGVDCPRVSLVRNMQDAVQFFEQVGHPVVIKPLTGSGSELVFLCESAVDCMRAFRTLSIRLADHHNIRMYSPVVIDQATVDPRKVFVAEEHIRGREFSCDFILDGDRLDIIRIARKVPAPDRPLGTIQAYVLPSVLAGNIEPEAFRAQLYAAATSLGLTRTIAMVDFMIRGGKAYLLELTPRPGGDCLPDMIRHSCGFDIIGANMDFAEGKAVSVPPEDEWRRIVGVRLFASRDGVLRAIETGEVKRDRRVLAVMLKRRPGDIIVLPPDDYDSWLLGTVIFEPSSTGNIESESNDLIRKVGIDLETSSWTATRTS